MPLIKIVACYQGNHKEFSSKKACSSHLQKCFFFLKPKDNFLLKAFLQHKEKEPNKNILNSRLNMPHF